MCADMQNANLKKYFLIFCSCDKRNLKKKYFAEGKDEIYIRVIRIGINLNSLVKAKLVVTVLISVANSFASCI